jgi:hypothetical protein
VIRLEAGSRNRSHRVVVVPQPSAGAPAGHEQLQRPAPERLDALGERWRMNRSQAITVLVALEARRLGLVAWVAPSRRVADEPTGTRGRWNVRRRLPVFPTCSLVVRPVNAERWLGSRTDRG